MGSRHFLVFKSVQTLEEGKFLKGSCLRAYPVRNSASAPSQVILQAAAKASWSAKTANIRAFQDSGKGSKGCHYSSPGKSGGTHGTGGKQDAEDHHVTGSGNRTIKNPGDHHGKKNFRKYRTTVVNLRKNRNGFFAQTLNETGAAGGSLSGITVGSS